MLKRLSIKENLQNNANPRRNKLGKIKPYFYIINHNKDEESLCQMEMKYLFNKIPKIKHFFSYHYVDPSRSPFIKQCISIIYTGNTLEDILSQMKADNLSYERFKVSYINYGDETLHLEERRKIEFQIGMNIEGEADLRSPEILLAVIKVHGKWIFGEYKANEFNWQYHNRKPYSYSNGLGVRVSRAIVNIAVANNLKSTVVDPCCGVGTVVLEALDMGINIKGWEINPLIAENAKKNLQYFDYENVITNGDMHNIQEKFDVSIVDLPYGLFSPTTLKEQVDIMKTARRISDKIVILSHEDLDEYLISSGFKIIDKCDISKGKFKRYVNICV
ncbi:RNA methyltransferase [Clostridium sp. CX1]|uniref:TRM11 family SAM-dependent methyltransferase n=1 Tax=Clostridium sp. CX1 TaxID=2978346 RepID=UPI0021BEBA5F|nr:RNA methyltransferase [Clostridium sp. CX1]MCT8975166.1 RNA methyltransferase [Clostridium sp. CX1]